MNTNVLKFIKSSKIPRSDGLLSDFFHISWKCIEFVIKNIINDSKERA